MPRQVVNLSLLENVGLTTTRDCQPFANHVWGLLAYVDEGH